MAQTPAQQMQQIPAQQTQQTHIPAFMTQAGYERALAESIASREHWTKVGERMKRRQEEQAEEWKRKDAELAKLNEAWARATEHTEKIQRDYAEIKKYSQEEIDEAIRQIRIERLKNLLRPYVP